MTSTEETRFTHLMRTRGGLIRPRKRPCRLQSPSMIAVTSSSLTHVIISCALIRMNETEASSYIDRSCRSSRERIERLQKAL